jgi:hypothetical protein
MHVNPETLKRFRDREEMEEPTLRNSKEACLFNILNFGITRPTPTVRVQGGKMQQMQ